MKKRVIYIISGALLLATLLIIIIGGKSIEKPSDSYDDGVKQLDANTIVLESGKVRVDFSKILLSNQEEMRKLIVVTQEATASYKLSKNLIKNTTLSITQKEEEVHYTAEGYFTVDLSKVTAQDIIDDEESKTLTIVVEEPELEAITIDPEKIYSDNKKNGLFAWGNLEITIEDYRNIEINLQSRLEKAFNTSSNLEMAKKNGLSMVAAVYEPIVKAIDDEYSVVVKYK